jgi:aspartyl-tRNA(Asn)/glutamyl-tRNA(Gln) amidotransferase subunit B
MYQTFIGLEIHIHLLTKSKVFCDCPAAFGDAPNTNVCPVCLGYPGVLPKLNSRAMEMAYLVAKALNCELGARAMFDRKNYFYPDMTKNYQISQFHAPVGRHGYFEILINDEIKRVGIHDVHLEEDAGKMIHDGGRSLVDYNRAGTSLLEIVTEPDIASAEEAEVFIQSFRRLVRYLGVCDGNMEEGSLRCDANVSINHPGKGLGTKTEVKNMNSSRFARKALQYEIRRQARLLDQGEKVVQETRLWDESAGKTEGMRTKESAHDYRYFPEPDMPPFLPSDAFMAEVDAALVELPLARRNRFIEVLGVKPEFADTITEEKQTADFFEQCLALGADPELAANWMAGHVQAQLHRVASGSLTESPLTPKRLADLLGLMAGNTINASKGKQVLELVFETDRDPGAIVKEKGWEQVSDTGAIQTWVDDVIAANPGPVSQIKKGDQKPLGFLVGQVMKRSKGQADPKEVNRLLREHFNR